MSINQQQRRRFACHSIYTSELSASNPADQMINASVCFGLRSSSDLPALSNFLLASKHNGWAVLIRDGRSCGGLWDMMLPVAPPSQHHIHQVQAVMTEAMLTRNKEPALKHTLDKVNHQHTEPWCETITEYKSMESRGLYTWTCALGTRCTFFSINKVDMT